MVDEVRITERVVVARVTEGTVLRENGWVAVLGVNRAAGGAVFQIKDWVGGSGALPDVLRRWTNWYIGPDGPVPNAADAAKFNVQAAPAQGGGVQSGSIDTDDLAAGLRTVVNSIIGSWTADGLGLTLIDQQGNTTALQFTIARIDVLQAIGAGGVAHIPTHDSDANSITFTGFDEDGGAVTTVVPLAGHDPSALTTLETTTTLSLAAYTTDDTDTELTVGALSGDHVAQGITKAGNTFTFANAGDYRMQTSLHAETSGGTGGGDRTVIDVFVNRNGNEVGYSRQSIYHRGDRPGLTATYDFMISVEAVLEAGDTITFMAHPDFEGSGQTLTISSSELHIVSGAVASIVPPARSVNQIRDLFGGALSATRAFTYNAVTRVVSLAAGWILPADLDAGTPTKKTAFRDAIGALGAQVQADFGETNSALASYIKNKPNIEDTTGVVFLDYRADLNTTTNAAGLYFHQGAGWQGANAPADVAGQRVFTLYTHATGGAQYLTLEEGAGFFTRPTPTSAWSELQVSAKPPFNTRRPFVLTGRQEAPTSYTPSFSYIDVAKENLGSDVNDASSNDRRVIQEFEFDADFGVVSFERTSDHSKTINGFVLSLRNGAETEADNEHTYPVILRDNDGDGTAQATYHLLTGNKIGGTIKGASLDSNQRLWFTQLGNVTGEVAVTLRYSDGTYSEQHQISHPGLEVEISPAQAASAFQAFLTTLTAGQTEEVATALTAAVRNQIESWARTATNANVQRQALAALLNAATGEEQKLDYDTAIKGTPLLDFSGAAVGSVVISAGNDSLPQHILSNARSAGPTGTLCALRYNGGTQRGNSIVTFYLIDDTPITIGLPLQTGVIDIITVESREAETDIRLNRSGGNWTIGTYELRVLN